MSAAPLRVFAYFLPPGFQWNKHHRFLFDPAFKHTQSYEETLKAVQEMRPEEKLGNVLLSYQTAKNVMHPKYNYFYTEARSTHFMHPEISVEQFLKVIKCCDPNQNRSIHSVQRCWNQVAPGSLSDFNLNVEKEEDLDPAVRKNLAKYYPPQRRHQLHRSHYTFPNK